MKARVCELCHGEASLYCISDSAYLCWDCDASVHGANFLVARHVRRTVCQRCKQFDGSRVSGVRPRPTRSLCRSCDSSSGSSVCDSDSGSSSTCISSSGSLTADSKVCKASAGRSRCGSSVSGSGFDRINSKAEAVLLNWSGRLGLSSSFSLLSLALRAVDTCLRRFPALPFRACLAASLWFAAKMEGTRGASSLQLKKLEECSGVPAKLIMMAESKLRKVLKVKKLVERQDEKEGWAEC